VVDPETLEPDPEKLGAVPPAGRPMSRRLNLISAVALVVVAAVALAIGSGLGRSAPPTLAERAASLETEIKCPSCEDISVSESEASTAVEARHQITQMLANGETNAQIEQAFVARWGTSILLVPPASGLGALVWILPSLAGAVALGALAVLFWRRQRSLSRLRAGPS
jgi:cytochrome c-type biogenesis protein CcmH